MVPPPKAMGVPPAQPEMNRQIMKVAMFWLRAFPMTKATKKRLARWYTGSRPKTSLREDMNMGPIAKPRTYRVTASVDMVDDWMLKVLRISLIPGAHMVGAMFLVSRVNSRVVLLGKDCRYMTRDMRATTMTCAHRLRPGQL